MKKTKEALIPRRAPSMAHGGCLWGKRFLKIIV
jgi:hypothetical protein